MKNTNNINNAKNVNNTDTNMTIFFYTYDALYQMNQEDLRLDFFQKAAAAKNQGLRTVLVSDQNLKTLKEADLLDFISWDACITDSGAHVYAEGKELCAHTLHDWQKRLAARICLKNDLCLTGEGSQPFMTITQRELPAAANAFYPIPLNAYQKQDVHTLKVLDTDTDMAALLLNRVPNLTAVKVAEGVLELRHSKATVHNAMSLLQKLWNLPGDAWAAVGPAGIYNPRHTKQALVFGF